MTYFLKVLFVSFIYVSVFPISNSSKEDQLGCHLIPSKIENPSKQNDLLDYLNHHNFYGKKYTCSSEFKPGVKYEFSVCGDASDKKPQASVIRRNENEGVLEAIGMRNSTSLAGVAGEWIYMSLGGGDKDTSGPCSNTNLTSSIMIRCDRDSSDSEFKFVYQEVSYCHFLFELKTAAFCDGSHSQGLGGWTILFIIFIVGFIVYFAAGFIYLRFVTDAKGIHQIPHRQFWHMLGNKIADCCNVVCRCNQCCGENDDDLQSPYSSGYSPIGESAPTFPNSSSQRDAPLLNP